MHAGSDPEGSRSALAATLEALGQGCVCVGADGRVEHLNAPAAQMLGWTTEQARGRALHEVVAIGMPSNPGDTSEPPTPALAARLVQPQARVLRRDGTTRPLEVSAALVPGHGGADAGLVVSLRDLAPLVQAESQARGALERFRFIVESAPSGLMLVDARGRIALVNRRTEELFGYTRDELLGQPVETLIPEHLRDRHPAHVRGLFAAPADRRLGDMRDLHGLCKDGREIPLEIALKPLQTPEGAFTLATLIDIAERKRQADELRRSNAELEQFAYVASHDLQEPLRMVVSYGELLAERYQGRLDERADRYIHYAVDGARRMQRLVADLLAYSRVGSQGKPLQPVDAGAVLDEVLHVLQATVQRTGATVLAQGLPTVLADPDQLHQLFMNLVGNALKFRGDAAPCVTVQASAAHGLWTFRVADNGIGIEPQFAERIFQMFQRLHDRERYEGSGIGLAISRRILERHGGRIWLDTDAVPGSTFCFTLPALTPPD